GRRLRPPPGQAGRHRYAGAADSRSGLRRQLIVVPLTRARRRHAPARAPAPAPARPRAPAVPGPQWLPTTAP
ncbi:MAG: hypothetical protein EOO24_64405, partial [Comamonadaceae bacterium]